MDVLATGQAIVYCPEMTVSHAPSPVRDAPHRRVLLARNAAWVGCLRLPWREVWQRTGDAFKVLRQESQPRAAYADLLGGLVWAMRRRKPLSTGVLTMLAQVRDAENAMQAARPTSPGAAGRHSASESAAS